MCIYMYIHIYFLNLDFRGYRHENHNPQYGGPCVPLVQKPQPQAPAEAQHHCSPSG